MRSMADCSSIDCFVTPYVDGELPAADRQTVAEHISACAPCRSRVAAEQGARDAMRARKPELHRVSLPAALRARCATLARTCFAAAPLTPAENRRPQADVI